MASEHIAAAQGIAGGRQDYVGISDTETEVQANYQGNNEYANAGGEPGPAGTRKSQSEHRLRTRTILLELANELEASRRELAATQVEKEQAASLFKAQIDGRNKELATLYTQLDRFFGLPGFALTKNRKKSISAEQDEEVNETLHADEFAHTLRWQLQELKMDIERLAAERENLTRYGPGQTLNSVLGFIPTGAPYTEETDIRLAQQQADFESVARRARERLVEQGSLIEALRHDLSNAQDSLRSIRNAQEEDVFSAKLNMRPLSTADRAALGASVPRPHSACADPHAGSSLFVDGMPSLGSGYHRSVR